MCICMPTYKLCKNQIIHNVLKLLSVTRNYSMTNRPLIYKQNHYKLIDYDIRLLQVSNLFITSIQRIVRFSDI